MLEVCRLFGGFFLSPANTPRYYAFLNALSYVKVRLRTGDGGQGTGVCVGGAEGTVGVLCLRCGCAVCVCVLGGAAAVHCTHSSSGSTQLLA
jgi:hypothetical protein